MVFDQIYRNKLKKALKKTETVKLRLFPIYLVNFKFFTKLKIFNEKTFFVKYIFLSAFFVKLTAIPIIMKL